MPSPTQTLPNHYHLHGKGFSVAYFPDGFRPNDPMHSTFQDSSQSVTFYRDDARAVAVPDIGVAVRVTLVPSVDTGATAFAVPAVGSPSENISLDIESYG